MSKYTVTFDGTGEIVATVNSIAAAKQEAEQFIQNGTQESVSELSTSLKSIGFATLRDKTFNQSLTITLNA
jgi:hypothetical protein